jgi:hypothetical protein
MVTGAHQDDLYHLAPMYMQVHRMECMPLLPHTVQYSTVYSSERYHHHFVESAVL